MSLVGSDPSMTFCQASSFWHSAGSRSIRVRGDIALSGSTAEYDRKSGALCDLEDDAAFRGRTKTVTPKDKRQRI